ncbi:MAG: tetratricopeptide repeat protein [bacterium]|nr:tetratricopeptide repeat protein [bacterium]
MIKFIRIFIIIILSALPLSAGLLDTEEIPTSIRAIGMGETFAGIADDATAIRMNPAGLAQLKNNELTLMYSDLFQSGLYNLYSVFAFPFQRINTIAVDWLYTGFNEEKEFIYDNVPELGYGEHFIYLSYARKIKENIFAGLNLKYYRINVSYDGETWADGQGIGADLGGLWKPLPKLSAGLVLKNIIPLKVYYENGSPQTYLDPSISLGVSYSPLRNLLAGLDINDSLHLGAEYQVLDMFRLRAGTMKGLTYKGEDSTGFSLGAGVHYKFARFDYAYTYNPDILAIHRFAASLNWGYHAYLVDVVSANIQEMFASLYKSYTRADIVRLMVKNKTKQPMNADVGIYISGLMKKATQKRVLLVPGIPTEVKLPVVFSDDVMEVTDDITRPAEIIVSYESEGRKSEDVTPVNFVLYNRNAFIWDNLDKLAGFVTPQDEKVKEFSRRAVQSMAKGRMKVYFISDNFYKAMVIFDALGSYGVTYISDPNKPFALTSEAKNAIDYIQYPMETLQFRSGDCDDCVVLFASCLENVGIPTMLVDVPGHIFMMFDTGLTQDEIRQENISEEMFLEMNGHAWLPVEATMFGRGFMNAWEEASLNLQDWLNKKKPGEETIRVSLVEESWQQYPSATLPEEDYDIELEPDKLKKSLRDDLDRILSDKDERFVKLKQNYESHPNDPVLNNRIGMYYAKSGLYNLAERYFSNAVTLKTNNAAAYNNLGNIFLILEDYKKAIEKYEQALKLSPRDPDIIENLNRARLERSKSQ